MGQIMTNHEQRQVSAAARKVGGYAKLIELEAERRRASVRITASEASPNDRAGGLRSAIASVLKR